MMMKWNEKNVHFFAPAGGFLRDVCKIKKLHKLQQQK